MKLDRIGKNERIGLNDGFVVSRRVTEFRRGNLGDFSTRASNWCLGAFGIGVFDVLVLLN